MSALLALAVQFYGAERLFHIWIPPWLENEGEITALRNLPESAITERLHPPLDRPPTERPQLVDLPFISLPHAAGHPGRAGGEGSRHQGGQTVPGPRRIAESGGNADVPRPEGRHHLKRSGGSASCPAARTPHIFHNQDRLERFAWELIGYAPFVVEVRGEEWRQGQPGVQSQPPNDLSVGIRLRTDTLFRFRLITTARTPGELEAARRHVERYIRRRGG